MTHIERQKYITVILDEVKNTLESKDKAYANEDDANSNFKIIGSLLQKSPYEIWLVYFVKHLISILNDIKKNPYQPIEETESMKGRITDSIGYLAILYSMLQENNNWISVKVDPSDNKSFYDMIEEWEKNKQPSTSTNESIEEVKSFICDKQTQALITSQENKLPFVYSKLKYATPFDRLGTVELLLTDIEISAVEALQKRFGVTPDTNLPKIP